MNRTAFIAAIAALAATPFAAAQAEIVGEPVAYEVNGASQRESGKLREDREALRQRLFASIETARQQPGVAPDEAAILGYCFGGGAVLELARVGADLDGFAVFHGSLQTPEGQDYSGATGGPVLILHGSADPAVPMDVVAALAEDMNAAGVDYQMNIYSGARHAFTVWSAEGDATQYDAEADRKSWDATMDFLSENLR